MTSAGSVHSITEPADQNKLNKIIAKIDNLQQHVEEIQKCNVAAVSVPKNVKDSDEMTNKEIQNMILVARSIKELETLGFEYNTSFYALFVTQGALKVYQMKLELSPTIRIWGLNLTKKNICHVLSST